MAIVFLLFITITVMAYITTCEATVLFSETFESEDIFTKGQWTLSKQSKYLDQPVKVLPTGENLEGYEKDLGVQLTQEMKHYGFGSQLTTPITLKGKDFYLQYEIKFLENFNCGGAYLKLLREDQGASLDLLDSSTPYSIMFGPDKCGATNKVHFILQYQNPIDHTWEEKHYNETIPVRSDKKTHLYTLAIHPDNTFEILVDNKEAKKGSLLTHFVPSINPDEFVFDPTDKKPADWVDQAEIDDPEAVKPDDWDESQPKKIIDPTATKPEGWLDDAPENIPNPDIKKPEDWDDEEDGEWEAPLIPNPECDKVGCGVWKPPLIDNPLYKGKWHPPRIPNPAFKGVWTPRKIKNPNYFEDKNPTDNIPPITALAVEVWTTNSGIHFDNFVITDSKDSLDEFTAKTFIPKHKAETVADKKESAEERQKERERIYQEGTLQEKFQAFIVQIVEFFGENPLAGVGTALAIIVPFIYLVLFGGKNPSVDINGKPVETKEKEEDQTEEETDKDTKSEEDKDKDNSNLTGAIESKEETTEEK